MERALLGESGLSVSRLGIAVGSRALRPSGEWRSIVNKARAAGVDLFDLADVPYEREGLFREFLAQEPGPVTVILRRSSEGLAAMPPPAPGHRDSPREGDRMGALGRSVAPLLPTSRSTEQLLVEWERSGEGSELDRRATKTLRQLVERGAIASWGVAADGPPPTPDEGHDPPGFVVRSLSLLHPLPAGSPRWEGPPLLVRDPFAGGRLDGTRFDRAADPLAVGRPPVPLSQLKDDFAPVLRLTSLAIPGRRTLAQAALRYVLDVVGATAALMPLPDPRRLDELLGVDRTPPLGDGDLAIVAGAGPRGPAPEPSTDFSLRRRYPMDTERPC